MSTKYSGDNKLSLPRWKSCKIILIQGTDILAFLILTQIKEHEQCNISYENDNNSENDGML